MNVHPFRPAPWLKNQHAQTVLGRMFRPTSGVTFRRERIETEDGDFVDLDFADVPGREWSVLGDNAPIVVLLHGLEGSARSGYGYQCYQRLAQWGIRSVGFNFRSCSGELNRSARLYHSGDTADPAMIFSLLKARFPNVMLGAIGVSLGGNVLLKHLGEQGDKTPLSSAVVVSVPFNLSACADAIHTGSGRMYGAHLLRRLKVKLKQKSAELSAVCDVAAGLRSQTIRQFDDAVTAPAFGFADAQDYYDTCSSRKYLSTITVPTLVLSAEDDPFLPPNNIPRDEIEAHPHMSAVISDYGGHVGFVEGSTPFNLSFWSEREAAAFIARSFGLG